MMQLSLTQKCLVGLAVMCFLLPFFLAIQPAALFQLTCLMVGVIFLVAADINDPEAES